MPKNELENLLKMFEDGSASRDPIATRAAEQALLVLLAKEQQKVGQRLNLLSFLYALLVLYNTAALLIHGWNK